MSDDKRLYTATEAAVYLACSVSQVRKLKRENKLPGLRFGKSLVFTKDSLDWLVDNLPEAT